MDEKISPREIENYSKRFTKSLLDAFFKDKDRITGQELLSFSTIGQVNYFIISELFTAWKKERKKLTSAYFDYSVPEVKEALEQLMKALSNHISMDRDTLTPLAVKAVQKTMLVIFAPYDYYTMIIEGDNKELMVGDFSEELKYLKVNKPPLEKLYSELNLKKIQRLPGNEAFAILDRILEEVNFTPDDVDQFVDQFSSVEPLDLNKLYVAVKPVQKAPDPSPTTVNDRIKPEIRKTLAEDFQKIPRIKDRLTINQKFMFTKVLFESDFEAFSKTVDDLDRLENYQDALAYLDPHLKKWDTESEEYIEFIELLEKRFA